MCPAGPPTSSSSRLARPFQTLRTTEVPSYSTHVVEPVNGCSSRLRCVFQVPISKSKSCWPSRGAAAGCGAGAVIGVGAGCAPGDGAGWAVAAASPDVRTHDCKYRDRLTVSPSEGIKPCWRCEYGGRSRILQEPLDARFLVPPRR